MMRLDVHSVEELLEKSEDKKEALMILNQCIQESAPELKRWLLIDKTYAMIGYGEFKSTGWPIIALAPQKNYVSLYVMGRKDNQELTTYYEKRLGVVRVGKSCINIRNINKVNLNELHYLIVDCVKWANIQ